MPSHANNQPKHACFPNPSSWHIEPFEHSCALFFSLCYHLQVVTSRKLSKRNHQHQKSKTFICTLQHVLVSTKSNQHQSNMSSLPMGLGIHAPVKGGFDGQTYHTRHQAIFEQIHIAYTIPVYVTAVRPSHQSLIENSFLTLGFSSISVPFEHSCAFFYVHFTIYHWWQASLAKGTSKLNRRNSAAWKVENILLTL